LKFVNAGINGDGLISNLDEASLERFKKAVFRKTPYTFNVNMVVGSVNDNVKFPVTLLGEGDGDTGAEIE
jgi:hypothetical protein